MAPRAHTRTRTRRSGPRHPARMWAATAGVVLLAAACGGDDPSGDTADRSAGQQVGAAFAEGRATTSAPPATGADGEGSGDAGSGSGAGADAGDEGGSTLPPPTIPASSTPPTTAPGTEPRPVPGLIGEGVLFGTLIVDLEPGGYVDLPVQLDAHRTMQVLSSADDGIETQVQVFAPDGSVVGDWAGSGRPGTVEGYGWDSSDPLPLDGTYVFRVEHRGGADHPFVLDFYG